MIHLLWPTVRPDMMAKTYKHWMDNADNPEQVTIKIATNTEEYAKKLYEHGFKDILIVGDEYRGVAPSTYALAMDLEAKHDDIVILASDDFYAPEHWDTWLNKQYKNIRGALLVNDGYQQGPIVTIPIMSYECLLLLNKIIYHPEYIHMWSDAELHRNLKDLGVIRNLRKTSPLFEHRHPDASKRSRDKVDDALRETYKHAEPMYKKRMGMSLKERLKMPKKWVEWNKRVKKFVP